MQVLKQKWWIGPKKKNKTKMVESWIAKKLKIYGWILHSKWSKQNMEVVVSVVFFATTVTPSDNCGIESIITGGGYGFKWVKPWEGERLWCEKEAESLVTACI